MALVTTTSSDNGIPSTWDIPPEGEYQDVAVPYGDVVYDGSQVIAAVGATDTATWTLQLNLPRNFVHKIISYEIDVSLDNNAAAADWSPAMNVLVSADKGGVSSVVAFSFEVLGQTYKAEAANSAFDNQFIILAPGALAGRRFFHPVNLPGDLIDASDAARLFLRWFNPSANATSAVTARWHVRVLSYHVDQLRKYRLHKTYSNSRT